MPIPSTSLGGFRKRLKLPSGSSPPRAQDTGAARGAGPPVPTCSSDVSADAAAATHSAPTPSPVRQQPTFPCNVSALENLGNTCFLNVILQVLRYTPGFVDELSALAMAVSGAVQAQAGVPACPASGDIDVPDVAATWRLVSSLQKLYDEMSEREQHWQTTALEGHCVQPVAPESLLGVLRELNPMFEGKEQHDAHELLRCIQCYLQDAASLVNNACRAADSAASIACTVSCPSMAPMFQQHVEMCSAAGDCCSYSSPSTTGCSLPSNGCSLPAAADGCQAADELLQTPLLGGGRCFVDPRLTSVSAPLHTPQHPWHAAPDRIHGLSTMATSCAMQAHAGASDRPSPWAAEAAGEGEAVSLASTTSAAYNVSGVERDQQTPTTFVELPVVVSGDAGKSQRHSGTCNDAAELGTGLHLSPKRARLSDSVAAAVDKDVLSEPSQASCHGLAGQSCGSMHQTTLTSFFSKKSGTAVQQPGCPAVDDPTATTADARREDIAGSAEAEAHLQCSSAGAADALESASAGLPLSTPDGCGTSMVQLPEAADITDRLFQGQVTFRTRCLECESSKDRGDIFADIIVPVRRAARTGAVTEAGISCGSERTSDDDGYDSDANSHCSSSTDGESCTGDSTVITKAFCEREFLQGENKYYCEHCMHHTEADISTHYANLPPILTVHLKRFAATYGAGYSVLQKLSDHVPTPLVLPCVICRSGEPCTIDSHRYFLYAIVVHVGSTLDLGHYVCHVRVAKGPMQTYVVDGCRSQSEELASGEGRCDEQLTWVTLDDDCATVNTSANDSIDALLGATGSRATPYLLFYSRGDARCRPATSAAGLCSGAAHSLKAVRHELLLPRLEPQPDRDFD